jgi:hypothetical protein
MPLYSIKLPGLLPHSDDSSSKVSGALAFSCPRARSAYYRTVEHLGLIKSKSVDPANAASVDSYMTPVPNASVDTTQSPEDAMVEDPLSDQFQTLWNGTAQKNTEILLNIFKTLPNNLVKSWKEYDVRVFLTAPPFLLR